MLSLILATALAQAPCPTGQCAARVSRPSLPGAIRVEEHYRSVRVYAAPQGPFAPCPKAASPRAGFHPVRGVGRALFRGCK